MKKISATGFLIILISLSGYSQGTYSKQKLEKASQEDLDLYLGKALKLKKAGSILTIAGPASFLTGVVFAGASMAGGTEGMYKFGLGMVFAGMGATAAGIPILITGSTRVKKVKKAMSKSGGIASINMIPCGLLNFESQKFQPGIRLKIMF